MRLCGGEVQVNHSEPGIRCFAVRNRTRGTNLAQDVRLADTPRARLVGLLTETTLEPGEGLWIYPTQAIHTFGLRFPIDVAFLDRSRRVKRVYHRLVPYRWTRFVWGAQSVLELPGGVLACTGTEVGDELEFSLREELPVPEENETEKHDFALLTKASE